MRPIDLQDNLSKAPLASREQAIQQDAAELARRQLAQALDEEHRLDLSRVRAGQETEAPENRVDREGGRGAGRQQRRPHGDDGDEPTQPQPSSPSAFSRQIDITA